MDFTVTVTAQKLRVSIRSIYNNEICELIYFLHVYQYLFLFVAKTSLQKYLQLPYVKYPYNSLIYEI